MLIVILPDFAEDIFLDAIVSSASDHCVKVLPYFAGAGGGVMRKAWTFRCVEGFGQV